MKIIRVTLKQHTPLLHFQHYEKGATLRGSELKPKLDKYIIGKLEGSSSNVKNDYCHIFIKKDGETTDVLNYKIRIVATLPNKEVCIGHNTYKEGRNRDGKKFLNDYPLVLSNMGGKLKDDEFVDFSFSDKVVVTICISEVSLNESETSLDKLILNNIESFFVETNFGQRSNKGFGSFIVTEIKADGNPKTHKIEELLPPNTQYFTFSSDSPYNFKQLFEIIDYYWKRLKSGINYSKRKKETDGNITRSFGKNYYKSYLYTYLNKKGLTWEKRIIKESLGLMSKRAVGDKDIKENGNKAFFARAHMGCPVNGITYRIATGLFYKKKDPQGKYVMDKSGKNYIWEEKKDDVNLNITIANKNIERIPSPIIFKPVFSDKGKSVTVYILFDNDVINAIKTIDKDTEFQFQINRNDNMSKNWKQYGIEASYADEKAIPLFPDDTNDKYIDYNELIVSFHKDLEYRMTAIDFKGQNILSPIAEITLSNLYK